MSEFIVGARGHDFGRHSVEELLSSIGDAGFRCTQLAYTKAVEGVKSYADVTPELVAATNAAVQKSGVSIAVDGTYVELSYADEDKRRAEVAKALSQVPVAKALRAGCMGSETTNMAKQPTVSRREAQEALLRSLGEILPVCEEQGVLFAVECVYYHAMNTPEAVKMVLDTIASPNLRVICDLANYVGPENASVDAQRRLWVRELDALGGVMGLAADATYLQSRMLNKGKGPAVHALRVQTDRKRYHEYMKHALELTPGLAIHQAEIISIEVEDGHVKGVVTQLNGEYGAKCVVIATGTNLGGKIFVGDAWYASGPDGMHAANALTESLKAAGLPLRRFKTGTPARVHRRSIDFAKLECQPGDPDNELQPFSFMTDAPMHNKVECWIAYTNPETHRIILDNIQRSPLYGGMIEGVGPRYCPSIEDKVVRFAGKDRHPIFVEPCGENTEEMYLQGASSSLPEDVQNAF